MNVDWTIISLSLRISRLEGSSPVGLLSEYPSTSRGRRIARQMFWRSRISEVGYWVVLSLWTSLWGRLFPYLIWSNGSRRVVLRRSDERQRAYTSVPVGCRNRKVSRVWHLRFPFCAIRYVVRYTWYMLNYRIMLMCLTEWWWKSWPIDNLESSDIPSKQECEGPVHRYQQLIPPSQCGRSVETTPYDPSEESDISSSLTICERLTQQIWLGIH